jgi:predicted RND superfamily exporter protein
MVYGLYVDRDLESALIHVDFYNHLVDYQKIFPQIQHILDASSIRDKVELQMIGEPILYGWVAHYLGETVSIALLSLMAMLVLLFMITRTWRGTLLPLIAGLVSAIWALGIGAILGYNFDPLFIVVAFIITARAFSHSVQLITRFDDLAVGEKINPRHAAQESMRELFRPGMLGLWADAGAILCVILTPIPLMHKVAIIGSIWVLTITISAVILTPVLLSWIKAPDRYIHPLRLGGILSVFTRSATWVVTTRARYAVAPLAGLLLVGLLAETTHLTVGDASAGSPILWQDSAFNVASTQVNRRYPGSEQMFIAIEGDQPDALKRTEVLDWMMQFQRYMERQPEIGGTVSLADVVTEVRRNLHEGNPRYRELGGSALENGELLNFYLQGSSPGDLNQYTDVQFQNGAVTMFFHDHKGETLRQAIYNAGRFIGENELPHAKALLAGGVLGNIAAVNEILLRDQVGAIALAFLVVVLCCLVGYRSSVSGIFFIIPVFISNVVTFAFMAWHGIGMSISTLPVVALGIGLGVDYAFYIVDGIKEHLENNPLATPEDAVRQSLGSAGRGVILTALVLAAGVLLWSWSSLRFQAEMGILIGIWLLTSAFTALYVMPSLALVFKPDFIFKKAKLVALAHST